LQRIGRLPLCAFIKWSGTRILEEALRAIAARPGTRLRCITTSYLGATDLKAIDLLYSLPAEVHPACPEIIGMGPAVVPLLLRELETDLDGWFWPRRCSSS
jgi:hypothetical protein